MKQRDMIRLAYGGFLLAAPPGIVGLLGGDDEDHATTSVVMRILGARHITQAVGTLAVGADVCGPGWLHRVAGMVDSLHLLSLPLLAQFGNPAQQRLLAYDAVAEALFAATEFTAAHVVPPRTHG